MTDLMHLYQSFSVVAADYLPAMQWAVEHEPWRYHAVCRADDKLCQARDTGNIERFEQYLEMVKQTLREARGASLA